MPTRLKITSLGQLTIALESEPFDDQLSQKAKAILLYVACQRRAFPRDQLASMFWANFSQERASANLRMTLMPVREHLHGHIEITRTEINVDGWVDAISFEDTIKSLRGLLSGQQPWTPIAAEQLEQTLQLYTADFLTSFYIPDSEAFETWSHATREVLRRYFLDAAEALTHYCEQIGHYAAGIHWAQRMLAVDGLDEIAYRRLMQLYTLSGDRTAALRQFEICRQALADELAVEPESATINLQEHISSGLLMAASLTSSALLVQPSEPRAVPNNLPGQLTPLIGRADDLVRIESLLTEARLITLLGTGGIGKTRLALDIAATALSQAAYPDGVFFVDLASIGQPAQVADAVAKVLQLSESGECDLSDLIATYLCQRKLLLVLDNFEQVVEAAIMVEGWLRMAPQLTVIVTSREVLRLYSEAVYSVPPLADADAIALFTRRVSAVKPSFTLTETTHAAVKTICERLEGLPLALELAAARARSLSLAQIVSGLDERYKLLQSDLRGLPDRQRTLFGAIEWSYGLLTPDEQALYRRLSIFVGGWNMAAAEAVSGELAQHLPTLVDKSVVLQSDQEPSRFRMLETIREHAAFQLKANGETAAAAAAHLAHFAQFAEMTGRHLLSAEFNHWRRQFELEYANCHAALAHSSSVNADELLCRIVAGIGYFWYERGYIREGWPWIERALPYVDGLPVTVQANLLASAGHLAHARGDYAHADTWQQRALTLYRTLDDRVNSAFMLLCLVVRQPKAEEAFKLLDAAHQTIQQASNDLILVVFYINYGERLLETGDFSHAEQMFHSGLAIAEKHEISQLSAVLQDNLGSAYREMGRLVEATRCLEQGLKNARDNRDLFAILACLQDLGDLYLLTDRTKAAQCYAEGLAAAVESSIGLRERCFARGLAMLAWDTRNIPEMKAYYRECYQGVERLETPQLNEMLLGVVHIASVLTAVGRPFAAGQLLGILIHIYAEAQRVPGYIYRHFQQQAMAALQNQLDADQLAVVMQRGQKMSVAELCASALEAVEAIPDF